MKLMYEMPAADRAAYDGAAAADEKLMYCVPFNVWEERFVSGWTASPTAPSRSTSEIREVFP